MAGETSTDHQVNLYLSHTHTKHLPYISIFLLFAIWQIQFGFLAHFISDADSPGSVNWWYGWGRWFCAVLYKNTL